MVLTEHPTKRRRGASGETFPSRAWERVAASGGEWRRVAVPPGEGGRDQRSSGALCRQETAATPSTAAAICSTSSSARAAGAPVNLARWIIETSSRTQTSVLI